MIVMNKYMKDITRKDSLRLFKSEYLNRRIKHEMRRREIYKELRGLGMPSWKAYQMSIKRMVIKWLKKKH